MRFRDGAEASLKLSEIYQNGKRVRNVTFGKDYDGAWVDGLTYSGQIVSTSGGYSLLT